MPPDEGPLDRFNQNLGAQLEKYATPQNIESMRESCIFNIITHGGMGFVFGGALGLFLSGMASTGPEAALIGGGSAVSPPVGFRVQAKLIFKEMGTRTWSSAKSFAKIAALFSGFECAVESYRAKHDLVNTVAAGCLTGAVLGAKSGPKSALLGCAGFAAFSTAIEHFMQESSPDD
jgi:hypothetical protein